MKSTFGVPFGHHSVPEWLLNNMVRDGEYICEYLRLGRPVDDGIAGWLCYSHPTNWYESTSMEELVQDEFEFAYHDDPERLGHR